MREFLDALLNFRINAVNPGTMIDKMVVQLKDHHRRSPEPVPFNRTHWPALFKLTPDEWDKQGIVWDCDAHFEEWDKQGIEWDSDEDSEEEGIVWDNDAHFARLILCNVHNANAKFMAILSRHVYRSYGPESIDFYMIPCKSAV